MYDQPSLLEGFKQVLQKRGLADRTVAGYADDVRLFCEFVTDEAGSMTVDWSSLDVTSLQRFFYHCLHQRSNHPRSLARKLSALRLFFDYLNEAGRGCDNPARAMPTFTFKRQLPRSLTLAEARLLLTNVPLHSNQPERDCALFSVFLHCGCRLAEAVDLRVSDVSLKDRCLMVRGWKSRSRIIPLNNAVFGALREWLEVRPKVDHDHVFCGRGGRPMSGRAMQYAFSKHISRSPLSGEGLSLHKLRHTCLVMLLNAGVEVKALRELAGHADLSSTSIYTQVVRETLEEKVERHPLNQLSY